ncbi:MAG: hypothetical protein R2779_01310 [Crocinitomicaceae bacterium]
MKKLSLKIALTALIGFLVFSPPPFLAKTVLILNGRQKQEETILMKVIASQLITKEIAILQDIFKTPLFLEVRPLQVMDIMIFSSPN